MGTYYGAPTYPGSISQPGMPPAGGTPPAESIPAPKETKKGVYLSPSKAKLVVEVPADAKLFIDDVQLKAAPGVRSFNTPTLEVGQSYYYMVRVETIRDGKPVSQTRRVIVRAGEIARADFRSLLSETVQTAQAK